MLAIEDEIEIRTFHVRTRQGPRRFQTLRDEWPRPMPGGGILLRDVAGDLYLVRDPADARPPEPRPPLAAARLTEGSMIRGSCLCGGLRFEYARAVTQVGICHCSQCRKVSGRRRMP